MEKNFDPFKWQDTERVGFLADGVFAIAMTLLVLDIRVPVNEALMSEQEVFASLVGALPKLLTYIMCFLVLGNFWISFTTQWKYIDKCNRYLYFHVLVLLLVISLIPFTAAFLSEHFYSKVAFGIFFLNLTFIGMALSLHWKYVHDNMFLKVSKEEAAIINHKIIGRARIAIPIFAIEALLCFISPYVSIVCFIVSLVAFMFGMDQKKEKGLPEPKHTSHKNEAPSARY